MHDIVIYNYIASFVICCSVFYLLTKYVIKIASGYMLTKTESFISGVSCVIIILWLYYTIIMLYK